LRDHAGFVQQIRIKVCLFFLFSPPPLSHSPTPAHPYPPLPPTPPQPPLSSSYSHPIPSILVISVSIYPTPTPFTPFRPDL
jgi:hypothetical protein